MSTDRTQHVLDAIDGALEDWSVSGDAMRWSPEPEATGKSTGTIHTLPTGLRPRYSMWVAPIATEVFPAAFRYLAASYADALDRLVIPMRDFGQAVTAAATAFAEVSVHVREEPEPELPPDRTDVRAHALWRAQHRHTGPERKPAGRQKRPRQV